MFNSHLVKVIVGFCGMIILGLGILVIIDSFREKTKAPAATNTTQEINNTKPKPSSVVLPPMPAKTPTKCKDKTNC